MPGKGIRRGACSLCGKDAKLQASHIISEFIYQPLYDEKHRAVAVDSRTGSKKTVQKGLRENLLCKPCEGHLAEFERVAAPCIRNLVSAIQAASPGEVRVAAPYRQFKLFLLAVLWRAGVATGSTWRAVDLGPHEPVLRSMLQTGVPGAVDEFPCIAVAPSNLRTLIEIIAPARRAILEGVPVFHFMFFGIHWFYFLAPRMPLHNDMSFVATHLGATVGVVNRGEDVDLQDIARRIGDKL